jgi:hypothetical protein
LAGRLGGPQSRSGRGGEQKNSQPLPGLEPPIIQRYTTELSQLVSTNYPTETNSRITCNWLYLVHSKRLKVKTRVFWERIAF